MVTVVVAVVVAVSDWVDVAEVTPVVLWVDVTLALALVVAVDVPVVEGDVSSHRFSSYNTPETYLSWIVFKWPVVILHSAIVAKFPSGLLAKKFP